MTASRKLDPVSPLLNSEAAEDLPSLKGLLRESWLCIDCGINTAPRCPNRVELEIAFAAQKVTGGGDGIELKVGFDSEIYTVRDAVWKKAGMAPDGGCLCIGCLETRLGRRLKPKDFERDHPFSVLPGTLRLLQRRK